MQQTEVCGETWGVSRHACENSMCTTWESVRLRRFPALYQWGWSLLRSEPSSWEQAGVCRP